MKFAIACLLAVVVCVSSEPCQNTRECESHGITHCGSGAHVVCDPTVHQCVCVTGPSGFACTTLNDCLSHLQDLNCDRDRVHCVDGTCRCTRH